MTSPRSLVSSRLCAAAVAIAVTAAFVAFTAAVDAAPAHAAESSHVSADASAPTQATRLDCTDVSAYAGPCEDPQHVRADHYVFAATRELRESGIHPAIAVAIAPATLAVDELLFPFALALEHLAN